MTTSTALTNNRPQAAHLPDGQKPIPTPLNSAWDSFFLDGPQATDDFMSEPVAGLVKP